MEKISLEKAIENYLAKFECDIRDLVLIIDTYTQNRKRSNKKISKLIKAYESAADELRKM